MQKKYARWIFLCFSVLVAVTIFVFSDQPSVTSTNTSDSVTFIIAKFLIRNFKELGELEKFNIIHSMNGFVRKAAHFSIYACLSFFVTLCLLTYDDLKRKRPLIYSVVICAFYAVTDEVHQYFVPGRSCSALDVLIDTCGALTGAAAVLFIIYIYKRIKK